MWTAARCVSAGTPSHCHCHAQSRLVTVTLRNTAQTAVICIPSCHAWSCLLYDFDDGTGVGVVQEEGANEKYHEAQKAYETLINPEKRSTYDQVRFVLIQLCRNFPYRTSEGAPRLPGVPTDH